ncbi:hypothetical protein GCM10020254_34750 [Streptomyces goshikiensis]
MDPVEGTTSTEVHSPPSVTRARRSAAAFSGGRSRLDQWPAEASDGIKVPLAWMPGPGPGASASSPAKRAVKFRDNPTDARPARPSRTRCDAAAGRRAARHAPRQGGGAKQGTSGVSNAALSSALPADTLRTSSQQ